MAGKDNSKNNNSSNNSAPSTSAVKDFIEGAKGLTEGGNTSKRGNSGMGASGGKSNGSPIGNAAKEVALDAASKIPGAGPLIQAARFANKARKMRNNRNNNFGNDNIGKKLNPFSRGVRGLGIGLGGDKKEEDKSSDSETNNESTDASEINDIQKSNGIVENLVSESTKAAVKFVFRKVIFWVLLMVVLIFFIFIVMAVLITFFTFIFGVSSNNSSNDNVANNSGECGFTINATSLSRDEYINAIKKYASSTNISSDFVNNAGNIYDKSKSMNINPELVVVRAIAESGARTTSAPYNYWGMGCTNTGGGKDCHSYNSFMDGVSEFLQNISKYDSLTSMMSSYSYLGDYWYNPGSGGQGGCYYASFIFDTIPTRVQTACKSSNKCSGNKCVKTTKDERDAYTKWQVEKNMAGIREKVFGLKSSEGVACNGGDGNFSPLSSYNLKHHGLKVLSKTLSSTERSDITNFVNSQVKSVYGTGAGVAMAGQSLTHALAQKGYYLGYCWGGDRVSVGVGKSWGQKSSSCSSPSKFHRYYGMDCSGFVSWSIRNGCNSKFSSSTASGFRNYGSGISLKDAKPGDLMASSGHVRLIIKNNGKSIIVAEESGSADGLIFNKYNSAGNYKIVSMSNWYKKHCKSK